MTKQPQRWTVATSADKPGDVWLMGRHGGAYVSRWKVIQIERETYTARGGYEVEHYRALIEKVS